MLTSIRTPRPFLDISNDVTVIAGRVWLLQRRQRRGELGSARITDDLVAMETAVRHLTVLVAGLATDAAANPRTP